MDCVPAWSEPEHHHSWDTIRTELNQMRRITTRLPKSKHRCMVTEIDQDLSPLLEEIFHILGFRYDPDETRTITEHTEEKSPRFVNRKSTHRMGKKGDSRRSGPGCVQLGRTEENIRRSGPEKPPQIRLPGSGDLGKPGSHQKKPKNKTGGTLRPVALQIDELGLSFISAEYSRPSHRFDF